jgi:hypothetical protein
MIRLKIKFFIILLSTANSSIATILFTNPSEHKINCVSLKILIYMEQKQITSKAATPSYNLNGLFWTKSLNTDKMFVNGTFGQKQEKIKELMVVYTNQNYLAVRVKMQRFYRERPTAWLDDVCVCTSMLRAISARFSESQASWKRRPRREHIERAPLLTLESAAPATDRYRAAPHAK